MWILFAFGSAVFAGLTSILAKCGIRKTDSDAATAIRTIVVLIFSWIMMLITGSIGTISSLSSKTWMFLILSGIATGVSWLCYFKALQLGDVNKVVPIDKSSTILTIILAFIFLGEPITLVKGIAVVLIGIGTFMMIQKKETVDEPKKPKGGSWLIYALLSTVFASLTATLEKSASKVWSQTLERHQNLRCPGDGMGGCICQRQTAYNPGNSEKRAWLYLLIRPGNRRILAVLLQGTA